MLDHRVPITLSLARAGSGRPFDFPISLTRPPPPLLSGNLWEINSMIIGCEFFVEYIQITADS
jgi:hypothetical protein